MATPSFHRPLIINIIINIISNNIINIIIKIIINIIIIIIIYKLIIILYNLLIKGWGEYTNLSLLISKDSFQYTPSVRN